MVGMFVCQIHCLGLAVGAQSCVEHDFLRVEPESGTLSSLRVTLKRPTFWIFELKCGAVLQSMVHGVCVCVAFLFFSVLLRMKFKRGAFFMLHVNYVLFFEGRPAGAVKCVHGPFRTETHFR